MIAALQECGNDEKKITIVSIYIHSRYSDYLCYQLNINYWEIKKSRRPFQSHRGVYL